MPFIQSMEKLADLKKDRIEIIDILRGFALLGIIIVHFTEQYYAGQPPEAVKDFGAKNIAAGATTAQAMRKISQPRSSLLSQPCCCPAEVVQEATNRANNGKIGSKYMPLLVPAKESAKKTGSVPAIQNRTPSRCRSGSRFQLRQAESAASRTKGVHGNRSTGELRK